MKQSFKGTKPAILQRYPEQTMNPNTIKHLGDNDDPIEVFPPEIFFKDIEPNQNYEVTVTVRNLTKRMRRIMFTKPKSNKFKCEYDNSGSVAAGLSMRLNLQFETNEEGNFHDMIEIHTEGYKIPIKLHMHALKPAPDIIFEPLVNLKFIPFGQDKEETVEFKNEGRIAGYVSLKEEVRSKSGVFIDPPNFHIEPNEVKKVRIGLHADAAEVISKNVLVTIEGEEKKHLIEVTATCVQQQLSIVFEEGGGQKSSLNFGTIYLGERREYPAFIVNNGPQPAPYKFKFLQGLRILDDNHADENETFVSPAEVGKELTDRVLTAEPLSGIVPPYSQIPVSFICRTKKYEKKGGFSDSVGALNNIPTSHESNKRSNASMSNIGDINNEQKSRFEVKPQDYASLAVIQFDEDNKVGLKHPDLKVQMMARAQYPEVKINRQFFSFGECPMNERRDMTLSIKNKSIDLPIDFNFSKIAHFRANPAKGKLLPDMEHTINISFEPKNFGQYSTEISLEILKGIYKIPINLNGNCTAHAEKIKKQRGPAAMTNDFTLEKTIISDEDAQHSTVREILKRRTQKPDGAISNFNEFQLEERPDQIQNYLAIKANKERAINFLKHQRINREKDERINKKIKETQRAPPKTKEEIEKDPDLGLESPNIDLKFEFTKHVDPLYVEKPIGKYEPSTQNLDRIRAKKLNSDNRIVKKKFKAEPITQTEIRDCQIELTGEQLQKINAGPQKINFKNVFVKSLTTRSFNISNDLRQHIYVRLMVDQYPELSYSTPLSQVIPPGQEAGFDIIFCSQIVKVFNAPITYYINDRPFTFLAQAKADPVSLELSKKVLKFQFPDENLDMFFSQSIIVTNNGNAPAKFKWQGTSKIFVPSPMQDEVPPGGNKEVFITFYPPGPKVDEDILTLKIEDGADEELRCQGTVLESKCAFLEKQLDFGNVHVGLKAKDQTIQIKNQMRTSAVFEIISQHDELKIFPLKGKINGDQKQAFTVSYQSNTPKEFSSEIVVNIRGGKQLRLPVKAKSIVPDIYIEESAIDFQGVTIGDQKELPVTIINNSDITAKLILDIRDYPEFEIILPDPNPDDDVHSEIMVPIHENPKYDDIVKMNPDEVDPIDQEDQSSDDYEFDEDAKRHVQLSIRATGRPFELKLRYTPQRPDDPKAFILPLSLSGWPQEVRSILRKVTAVGEKPRFFLDPTIVNFKTKVIAKGQKPLPFHNDIQISNPDPNPVKWRIDRQQLEGTTFTMNPTEGVLEPGVHSTVRVTFNPHEAIEYVTKVPLFLDDENEKPYLTIEFRGQGAEAKIFFDRREVILPPVPLDIETKASFWVCHNGYENQELHYKIANEVGKLPIVIEFPDGKNLGVTKSKVKVEASFKFSTPLSFTTFIDFIDDEGKKFQIPISGTTDNSIFTNFSFLQRFPDEVCFRLEQGKPIKLDQQVISDMESAKTGGGVLAAFGGKQFSKGASSVMSRTAKSLVGYNPVDQGLLQRNCLYITKWFTNTISQNSMQNFPQDVVTQNGAQIFDLINFLSGKKPPGQATQKQLQQAANGNAKDSLNVLMKQYEELINFLKVNGAHLNTVRPEYLLNSGDYIKFLKINPKEENWKPKSIERLFPYIQMESWITIFYQVLRIYYLNRVTAKNFKLLPGMPQAETTVDNAMQKSNIYSTSETILLKWMQYHYNQMNPMHPKTLTNFDADLHDSTVFAALIRSHYGDPQSLKDFRNIPTDKVHYEKNAQKICKAVEEIGIITHITPEDITEPSAREILLFCVQLYQALPHYIPKATIEFPAVLGDMVTKNIELSNPSKTTISYWVKLIGANDYQIDEKSVKIEPSQTIPFPIKFQSRISKVVKGKVIFTNKREGNVQAAAMVFELVSNVYERNSIAIEQRSTKLYKALPIELTIDNAFSQDCLFNVQIQYERNQPQGKQNNKKDQKNATSKDLKQKGKEQATDKKNQQNPLNPEPYTCKQPQLKVKNKGNATLQINFLPFELGIHKCNIILTDENVGEVQYTIIGKAELPEILDTFSGDCNAEEPYPFIRTLNYRNEKLEQARNQYAEKDRKENKVKRDGPPTGNTTLMADDSQDAKKLNILAAIQQAQTSNDPKTFEIEISNPFFTGPNTLTLFDLNAAKTQAAKDQKNVVAKPGSQQEIANHQNILELNSNPQKPAIYTCYVILKSLDRTDIRLYEYKLTAIPQKIKAQLEFRIPAREIVPQDIPIVNNSSSEWKVTAVITDQPKGQLFTLSRDGPPVTSIQKIVKKNETGNITLFFKPQWVCNVTATLTLKNESTKEEYEYELKGIGEEPLAIDHVILNCKARETKTHIFEVKNATDKPVTYTVWTDLQNAVGTKEFIVKPRSSYDYKLSITPLLGGVYTASITFQDTEDRFMWWTVEVRTDSPKPSQIIDLRAFIRKAVSAEMSLSNPLNEPITFEVFYQGEGLIGDPTFSLEQKSVGTYNLIFSPLTAGISKGNIGFLNEKVGEFWYDLDLTAEENPISNLTLLECELGKNACHQVELENPTDKELFIDYRNSNPANFEIIPEKVILSPYETLKVQIQYSPTTLDVIENGNIIFDNPQVGKWEFNLEGKGLVPTMMEPQPISTSVGSNTSSMLSFKNPFKEPAVVSVHMEGGEDKIFSLLLKRNKFNIGPLGVLQIPYSFSPVTMTESKATIFVSMSKQLVWKYPLRGIAESVSTTIDYYFRTRSRRPFQDTLKINLPGFTEVQGEETFTYEINVQNPAFQSLVDRSVFIDQKTEMLKSPGEPIVFDLRFEPLRPFKTQTEFIIYKSSGGRWKFNVIFEALEPDVDDIITIASPLQKTSSVSFKLTNHLKAYSEFTAFFTADSAVEFVCHPKSGLLEPYGKEGTNFIVSFTPTEYGKTKIGKLVIQTEEMQWTYEIRGSHPQYKIPQVQGGRIQNKLSKEIATKITHKEKKNFLRENLQATKYGSSPERNSQIGSKINPSPKRIRDQSSSQ